MLTNLIERKTANLFIPDPAVEESCYEVMGLRFGLTVGKAVQAVHVLYFLFSLPAQEHPSFNAS